jgi:hypothetical protein
MNSAQQTDEQDIRTLLIEATRDLDPSPELLDRVRRGVRARRRRHRVILAATAVALLVVVGGPAVPRLLHGSQRYDAPLAPTPGFDEPTRGDLAGDTRYRNLVGAAWSAWAQRWRQARSNPYQVTGLGATHLAWALRTPAGRVAVIEQKATLVVNGRHRPSVAVGYLTDIAGSPRVVDAVWQPLDQPPDQPPGPRSFPGGTGGMFAGADRSVLLVFDPGVPTGYSPARTYHPDGQITRDWHPLRFTGGVAVIRVPPRADQGAVAVAPQPYAQSQPMELANVNAKPDPYQVGISPDGDRARPDGRLRWGVFDLDGPDQGTPDPKKCGPGQPRWDPRSMPFRDPLGASGIRAGTWAACGTTPDGSYVTVSDAQLDGDPAFVWYALRSPAGVVRYRYVGPVDKSAPLPVKITLPDRQGYVIARDGALLRYRIGAGPWQGERHNAMLLPGQATAVQVTAGATSTIVPLG